MPETIDQVSAGISALTEEYNVIAHNLANISTVGYKRRCSEFLQSLEAQQAVGEVPVGEVTFDEHFDFSQGNLVETDRPLDMALFGKGFFVIETAEGPRYTRNGTFHLNANGQVVNSDGRLVAGDAGPIVVPPTVGLSQLYVSSDGMVSAGSTGFGKFRLVDFGDDQDQLEPTGASCFMAPEGVEAVAAERVVVKQRYHEASNVQMIDELVNMITVARLYEANMRFISAQRDASSSLMSVAMG